MYALIAVLILAVVIGILQSPVFGLATILLVPLIKDVAQLPADNIVILNLLFLFTLITIFSTILKYSRHYKIIHLDMNSVFLFIAFMVTLIVSMLYSDSFEYGLEKLGKFILFNSFLFIGGMIIFQFNKNAEHYIKIVEWGVFLISLVNAIFIVKYIISGELAKMIMVRVSVTGANPIGMARVCGLGVLFWLISLSDKRYNIALVVGILIPITVSLIAAGSRGPVLAVVVSLLIYVMIYSDIKIKHKIGFTLFVILLAIAIYFLLPESLLSRYSRIFQENTFSTSLSVAQASSSNQRFIFMKRVLQYFGENPGEIIFGAGMGSFKAIFDYKYHVSYPHNIFFEVLYEQGIIGLIVFLGSLVYIFNYANKYIKHFREHSYFVKFYIALIYFLLNAQVSGDISINRFIWFFMGGIVGLIIKYEYSDANPIKLTNSKDFAVS